MSFKSIECIECGDIFLCEFGSGENFCRFVFENYEIEKDNWIKINYHRINEKETSEALYHYGKITDELKIVGKED